MKKAYFWVGGGILLAVVIGIFVATNLGSQSSPDDASSPNPVADDSSSVTLSPSPSSTSTATPTSPGTAKPTPAPSNPSSPATTGTTGSSTSPRSPASPSNTVNPPVQSVPQTTTSTANALKVDVCRISEVKVLDPNPPLNLRSTPEVTAGNVVGSLANGTFLRVMSDNKDWFQVSVLDDSGTVGWVSKQRTDYSCNEKQATLTLQPGNSALPIRDRFVSAGNHTYTFTATQGQTLTLVVQSGPAPYLVSPSQDLIAGDGQGGGINGLWSGKLPTTGRYTLSLDSNFRGYSYAFSVQLAN